MFPCLRLKLSICKENSFFSDCCRSTMFMVITISDKTTFLDLLSQMFFFLLPSTWLMEEVNIHRHIPEKQHFFLRLFVSNSLDSVSRWNMKALRCLEQIFIYAGPLPIERPGNRRVPKWMQHPEILSHQVDQFLFQPPAWGPCTNIAPCTPWYTDHLLS